MMKITRYLLFFACFIPLLYFRDFTPNNELKYLSIADEALREGHWFTFWNHGALYADKPPLYLWIVMATRYTFDVFPGIVFPDPGLVDPVHHG